MSEIEQLRGEVSELREAVLRLAHTADAFRLTLRNLPKGQVVGEQPKSAHLHLATLCYWLRGIPENTTNIRGAPWLVALEKSGGKSFDEIHAEQRAIIEKETEARAAAWKQAELSAQKAGA